MASISAYTSKHEDFVLGREEVAMFGKWRNDRPASHADTYRADSLDPKYPWILVRVAFWGFWGMRQTISRHYALQYHPSLR
jgi:hypothetical protein